MGGRKDGGDWGEEFERLRNRKRQSCVSSLSEKEKLSFLKKRGQGRLGAENVQSIMDSIGEWE
jgi:hypothetical protein